MDSLDSHSISFENDKQYRVINRLFQIFPKESESLVVTASKLGVST